jgi:hypothetical protein
METGQWMLLATWRPVIFNDVVCARAQEESIPSRYISRFLQAKQAKDMADNGTRGEVRSTPFGARVSRVWLCAGSWEMVNSPLEYRDRCSGYTAGTKRKLNVEV